jgi:acyl-CoA synthetase (AMP-forming)/AMP-acid ligase II
MAGAPVPAHVLARCKSLLAADGEVHTPYGATEALPVACVTAGEVLGETASRTAQGGGTCVGKPFPNIEWRVIGIDDGPILMMHQATVLPRGSIGELIVRGPVVTDRYVTRTEANALHKIADGSSVWHRMGDVGYLDDQNRFWFCGRKSHRLRTRTGTLFTIPCEAIVNQHPSIYRSALVGIGPPGAQIPAIVAEPWPEHWPRSAGDRRKLLAELKQRAADHELTSGIEQFILRKRLPVDIRHNAKIFREQLAVWATRRFGLRPRE